MKRIDNLTRGEAVQLRFDGADGTEHAVFVGVEGEGEDRRASFVQVLNRDQGTLFMWDAYRFNRRWVYGTSAQRLSLA